MDLEKMLILGVTEWRRDKAVSSSKSHICSIRERRVRINWISFKDWDSMVLDWCFWEEDSRSLYFE